MVIAGAILASYLCYAGTPPLFVAYGVAMTGIGMLTLTGNNGHVVDNPNDLMYDGPRRAQEDIVLDPGNDDYYDHDDGGCWDVKDHPVWE